MDSDRAKEVFQQAKDYYERGRYTDALALFRQLEAAYPSAPAVLLGKGLSQARLGWTEGAMALAQRLQGAGAVTEAERLLREVAHLRSARRPDAATVIAGAASHRTFSLWLVVLGSAIAGGFLVALCVVIYPHLVPSDDPNGRTAPIARSDPPQVGGVPAQYDDDSTLLPPPVESNTFSRGIAVLASDVGEKYPVDTLLRFVQAGDFRTVVVDWAWITYHWERTDFAAVRDLVDALEARDIEVAAMYRPRFLENPTVPIQVKEDGSSATSHGFDIRFTSPEARDWAASWGTEILAQCPQFDEIIIYNPRNSDRSPEALAAPATDTEAPYRAVTQFLREARESWRHVKPDVRLGVVYMNDPAFWQHILEVVDRAHPFLLVKQDVDVGTDTYDVAQLIPLLGGKLGFALAKVTWGEGDGVTPAHLQAFDAHARQYGLRYALWTFDTLFDSTLYDPAAVARVLGLDPVSLCQSLHSGGLPVATQPGSTQNAPMDWIYFISRENPEGKSPELVLSLNGEHEVVPAGADSLLISYLANGSYGFHHDLSVSMNDSNRVLLWFDLSQYTRASALDQAELALDMRLSRLAPKAPFEVGVHRLVEPWTEQETTWANQPRFEPTPLTTARLAPEPGALRIDVTGLVRSWMDGMQNHGLLIKVVSPIGERPTGPSAATPPPISQDPVPTQERGIVPSYAQSPPRPVSSPPMPLPPPEVTYDPLPWPHEPPGLSREERTALSQEVWIINDFPLYQYGDTGAYIHAGLDIVLDADAPIYAMKNGWVKSVKYATVIVADTPGPEPAFGWAYTHLRDIQVQEGQRVRRGTLLGRIAFEGLPHLHLAKVYSRAGYWGEWHYTLMPNAHFTYPDDEPPVIETPFHFFRNGANSRFEPDQDGTVTVKGDVDIVVAMRERGAYARSRDNGFGDRLGVTSIDYAIRSEAGGVSRRFRSFDFSQLALKKASLDREYNTDLTRIAYKHPHLFEPPRENWSRIFNYYIITNCPADRPPQELSAEFSRLAWRTAGGDSQGRPVYPNGFYVVTVRARDSLGNAAAASMRIRVRNTRQR